ncbi:MAG: sensor histidine kinase [Lachnospiraceae bacterium]|nr:sensor histidine kinase [Lachnospiraceae bacterium]
MTEEHKQETFELPLTILENERSRISRELHDVTIQNLVHTIHQTELILRYMDSDPIKAKLEITSLSRNLKHTIQETRNIIFDLKPMTINDLGFSETLDEYVTYLNDNFEIHFSYDIDAVVNNLDKENCLTLYRVIQEACTNIMKHSHAQNAEIKIWKEKDGQCILSVKDDGVGCQASDLKKLNHYGLQILEERVQILSGTCEIETKLNQGFHLTVKIPVSC